MESRTGKHCPGFYRAVVSAFWGAVFFLPANAVHGQTSPASASPLPLQDYAVNRFWQFGGFVAGGFPPSYKIDDPVGSFKLRVALASAGLEAGRMLTAPHGASLLRGRGEAMAEVIPFWLAYDPRQTQTIHYTNNPASPNFVQLTPYSSYGASITPFIFRWNSARRGHSLIVPWAQLGVGVLWTNHKFPILEGSTCVFNFTPQYGAGVNLFHHSRHSVSLAGKMVHISNARLGDYNPGMKKTVQLSAGYTWWK
jgi:hypothetical protein